MTNAHTVVGIGELLWDLLPSGKQLGGAPANFAYCSHLLGENAIVASRVGDDRLGTEIREMLGDRRVDDHFIQTDPVHPTGTVEVELNNSGQPVFKFTAAIAWDFLDWTEELQTLATEAHAVCFGSLAQRAPQSRRTIRQFAAATKQDALRVFDVNLRQSFYSAEVIRESLALANVVKLNHEEVSPVRELLAMDDGPDDFFAQLLIERFGLKLVCITRGAHGSLLVNQSETHEHPGFRVQVKDTVGSGDAFTAALVHGMLRQRTLPEVNEAANRLGAWVASQSGAMPEPPPDTIEKALAEIG